MRNISLRDLKLADSLSHLNEIELIHPQNEDKVKAVLAQIGFDVRQKIDFIPSYHRDMSGKAEVGFQVIGEYDVDPKYNKFIDTIDRVVVAGYTDINLAKDMAELMGRKFNYKNEDEGDYKAGRKPADPRYYSEEELLELGYTTGEDEDVYDDVDNSCEALTSQIEALQTVKEMLRGKL